MKNRIITIGIALLMTAGYSSCKKDAAAPVVTNTRTLNEHIITNGKWVVTSFEVNGVEHSDFYTPYTFRFMPGGLVVVSGSGKETTGKWSMSTVKDHPSLQADFGTTDPFNLLSNSDWNITKINNWEVEMKGTRGDDGEEVLVLKRI